MAVLARLLFALAVFSLPIQSTRTIMAINAGGDTTIAADGEVYERDRYYQGGVVSKKGKDLVINGTNSPALYQTERFAIGEELWYSLPIPFNVGHNGRGWTFVLTLKFVEVQFNATGRRMFGVNLNGLHVLRDIDVFSMVGWGTAYDEQIEFRIDPDHYAIWVTSVGPMRVRIEQPAAFYGDLHVALTPTEFGNARLCAMQLTQGTLEELDAAAEQSDPSRRRLSSTTSRGLGVGDESLFTLRTALFLLGAGTACALLVRELLAWKFKKRTGGLPAKLREKVGSQPAADARGRRGSKGERDTPSKSSKRKSGGSGGGAERSSSVSSSDGEKASSSSSSADQNSNKPGGRASGGSKGAGSNNKSSPEQKQRQQQLQQLQQQPESPRTQQKREERTRQKKEQKDKQKEKSRQESMRAEAEALSKAKAAAQNAARRSAAALAALEEVHTAEAEREAELLQQKQIQAKIVREAAAKAETAARVEAKLVKAKLKKKERKIAAKLSANANANANAKHNGSGTNAGAPRGHGNSNSNANASSGGASIGKPPHHRGLPAGFNAVGGGGGGSGGFGPSSIGLGVDWSSMGTLGNGGNGGDSNRASGGGGGMTSRLSNASLDEMIAGSDDGDLDIDVFAVLQDEIMSRETQDGNVNGGAGGGGAALDESRLLSNLIDFLDTDDSDSESLGDSHSSYSDPSDFFGGSGGMGGLAFNGMNQLSANAPEFTPTFGGGGDDGTGQDDGQGGYDVASLSVEVWMDAHDLSQYTSNLLDAGLQTVGDMLESMPLTHDHLKSLGLTKLRGRLLLMNSLKTVLQGTEEDQEAESQ